ncbi:hypothetical protein V492_05786, partial [Pseudogymnoascus sp. VKM F-4246]
MYQAKTTLIQRAKTGYNSKSSFYSQSPHSPIPLSLFTGATADVVAAACATDTDHAAAAATPTTTTARHMGLAKPEPALRTAQAMLSLLPQARGYSTFQHAAAGARTGPARGTARIALAAGQAGRTAARRTGM